MQLDRNIWDNLIKDNKIIGKKNCPFCAIPDENEKKLILFETNLWQIRYNKYPYGGIKKHILVIPKRHVELSKDLSNDELIDLRNINKYLYIFFEGEKYFSFLRETFQGRSIKHLHYHYILGNIHGSDFAEILNKQGY